MAREVFTSYPPLELSLTGRFVARLLLRAAREDVGDEEEEESGQPGKVSSNVIILLEQTCSIRSSFSFSL